MGEVVAVWRQAMDRVVQREGEHGYRLVCSITSGRAHGIAKGVVAKERVE